MTIFTIALNTYREAIRNKIMYLLIVFAIAMVGISALFGAVSIGNQEKVIKDFGLFAMSFIGTIATIVAGVNLLNKEISRKTIYNILSKPVSRWEFIIGKFLGLSITSSLIVCLMGCGLLVFSSFFEGNYDWLLLQGMLFSLLEMQIIAALVIFFSSLVITTTLTGLFTFGTYIAGRSVEYLSTFLYEKEEISSALRATIQIMDTILPKLSIFNIGDRLVYGNSASIQELVFAMTYACSYAAIAVILAILIFEQRELV